MLPEYSELHCVTNFSFLRGASRPEELVARAAALGYSALAVTDECSLAGVVRAHVEAKERKLKLIIGSEIQLTIGDGQSHAKLVALAKNREGYGNLSELITLARMRADKGLYRAHQSDLEGCATGYEHLAGLPHCFVLLIPALETSFESLLTQAMWLKKQFGENARIAVENLLRATDSVLIERAECVAAMSGIRIVATGDVHMHVRSRKPLLDVQVATRLGKSISECGFSLASNAEQYLRPRVRLAQLYADEWLEETVAIANECRFCLDELKYEYPEEIVPPGETPSSYLRKLTEEGALKRFPAGVPVRVRDTIEKELKLIGELKYEAFFLTIEDIVREARRLNILCQGRGSAANSVVCYCLGITEVDPVLCQQLLFERFVSKERNEPPDIDVDFEHQRREDIIQYIYKKYGRERTALAATVICYRTRSALRDVGKALGIDPQRIDQVAKSHHGWHDGTAREGRLHEAGFNPENPIVQQWIQLTDELRGFPRHLSQHVGGFVIAKDKLSRLVPIENAAMEDRSVIQWDKDDLDALNLIKVDVLALGMLSAIRRACEFIGQKKGAPFAMSDIKDGDEATYEMIRAADTIGTFQIESRAQMSMLPRLKPRVWYDLVIQIAIVRPGPIEGGMVHPYLRRREGEKFHYPNPELEEVLARTHGVPIFQEQVMQLAMVAAKFTPGEADQLRRSMAAWKRHGGLEPFQERLISKMIERGYTPEFASSIFEMIRGFGSYGFPESHAASFALLAYDSCWIKRHHPDAFLAAMLNSQPMGFYAPAQLIQDAKRHLVEVRPVDVTISQLESVLEPSGKDKYAVRLGLNLISGLPQAAAERVVRARSERMFETAEDLALRAELNAHELHVITASGALKSLAGHRHQAHWQALGVETRRTEMMKPVRFGEQSIALHPPSEGQDIVADYASLSFTLGRHPVGLLRTKLAKMRIAPAAELKSFKHGRTARACGIVTHRQRPETAKGTIFITLEDETGPVNVIIWNRLFEQQTKIVTASRLLAVQGTWQSVDGVQHLLARKVSDQTKLLGRLDTSSRDFR